MLRNKRGVVSLYIVFFIVAILIIVIAAVLAPAGVRFNTELWTAGEDILQDTNPSIENIKDDAVRESWNGTINAARNSADNNIGTLSGLFQYGWVIVLVLAAIVVFLATRRIVEFGGGGFI